MAGIVTNPVEPIELSESSPQTATAGGNAIIDITDSPSASLGFTIDVPENEPITELDLSISPSPLPTRTGLSWEGAQAWTHPDSTANGVGVDADGMLTAQGGGTVWDFDNGNDGWTFSNSYAGRVTSPTCGFNGSSGASIRTYAGSTYATSPVVDLSVLPTCQSTHGYYKAHQAVEKSLTQMRIFCYSTKILQELGQQ